MNALNGYLPMGLGTVRLPIGSPNDTAGIEKSAQLILKALDAGVNYIDTSYPYSAGGAHPALKIALKQTGKPYGITVKVHYQSDKTADETRRRVAFQLKSLGIDKASFFVCWSIQNYDMFTEIMRKGGVYDGALKLKDEGIIDHICCSLHAPMDDSIKIIESGAFEAATISFNILNAVQTLPVLDAADKHHVDVAIMNPLGGGVVPQNSGFFSFAQAEGETTVTAALRFAKSHPAIKIVLSGLNNESELKENLTALTEKPAEPDSERISRVTSKIKDINGFCVNCHYCDGCPVGIPVSQLMSDRNNLLFHTHETLNRTNKDIIDDISLFYTIYDLGDDRWLPDTPENPCIHCGQCEKNCTQKLKVIESIDDTYNRAQKSGFSLQAREERLRELLCDKHYRRVGLYPNDRFADTIMKLYKQFFGAPDFEWLLFNSDAQMWGQTVGGLRVHAPDEISGLMPDIIIVCSYKHDVAIYNDLRHFEDNGIKIVKLHRETDVPWVF